MKIFLLVGLVAIVSGAIIARGFRDMGLFALGVLAGETGYVYLEHYLQTRKGQSPAPTPKPR